MRTSGQNPSPPSPAAPSIEGSLELLKSALLTLPDSGERGFEGLCGALMGAVTHAPFRLASSGSQGGEDGRGEVELGSASFEAKLYREKLSNSAVQYKVAQILERDDPPDLWILAATAPASTQIVRSLKASFAKMETTLLVLDWPANHALPPLAVLCAMEPDACVHFLEQYCAGPPDSSDLRSALAAIAAQPGFALEAERIGDVLTQPMNAPVLARLALDKSLGEAFGNAEEAKRRFGQPLAPAASFALGLIERKRQALVNSLFTAAPDAKLGMVVGDQGSGKSWSVAQGWLASADRPLTIVLTAAQAFAMKDTGWQTLLARALLEQCGEIVSDAGLRRWGRRFERWRGRPAPSPRLILVVDGLNERAAMDWAPWLSNLVKKVSKIGGRVIATSRTRYFERIKWRLTVDVHRIEIPELADDELDAVLRAHGIVPGEIAAKVRQSLRNPRILGIALELLSSGQIQEAAELSIERLLFEHLRASQSDLAMGEAPGAFARLIADHARTVRERIASAFEEDLHVFDSVGDQGALEGRVRRDLLPVMEERFFETLEEDPTLYRLSEEGLVYGLGIATIRELQKAERSSRSVVERLADMVEPVAALDKVAEVLFAASVIASVDARVSDGIRAALLARLVQQQNVDDERFSAFCSIVRSVPSASLDALQALDCGGAYAPQKDWLVVGLRLARSDLRARRLIVERIDKWLRLYSLDPAQGVTHAETDPGRRSEKLAEARTKIEEKLGALTPAEQAVLAERMERSDGTDSMTLSADAFAILAGLPLEEFGEALVCWAFGRALNSRYDVPWEDYSALIQHNLADWPQTRSSLMKALEPFLGEHSSRAGRWTLVNALRATGSAEDAARAKAVADDLLKDFEGLKSWRLIEDYCASDPCDPASEFPANIEQTASNYRALDPASLMVGRWMGQEEHFLADAAPGLARFAPDVAASKFRDIAANVVCRRADQIRFAHNWLMRSVPLLDEKILQSIADRIAAARTGEDDSEWVPTQFLFLALLSHRDGDAQLDILSRLPDLGPPLVDLEHVFRPADPSRLAREFHAAARAASANKLLLLLSFARSSGTPLSPDALRTIRSLVDHPSKTVRALAMELSARHPDYDQLERFAASGWSAATIDARDDYLERWYGSSLIIEAADRGLIPPAEALGRIATQRLSSAARVLGSARVGAALADLLEHCVSRMLGARLPFEPPPVSQGERSVDGVPRLSLEDDEEKLSFEEKMRRVNEGDEEFEARHKNAWERFSEFETELTKAGAELVVRDIGHSAIAAIADARPETLRKIARQILELDEGELVRVANLAFRIAGALSESDPELSVALFRRFEGRAAYVRVTMTMARISLASWECWHCKPSQAIHAFWAERLNLAPSNEDIANEVLAASVAGRQQFLERFAEEAIAAGRPARIARGLTVLGFLDRSGLADRMIERFRDSAGMIGEAARAAAFAYERNLWSRHWFDALFETDDSELFWRFAILLEKIVDSRFILWGSSREEPGKAMAHFGWTLDHPVERRIASWSKKRAENLFGSKRPRPVFIDSGKPDQQPDVDGPRAGAEPDVVCIAH